MKSAPKRKPAPPPVPPPVEIQDAAAQDRAALKRQIEYYFSDQNLQQDEFFHEKIADDIDGWLDAIWILGCKKIRERSVTQDAEIEAALTDSHLETRRKDGELQVRRTQKLPPLKNKP